MPDDKSNLIEYRIAVAVDIGAQMANNLRSCIISALQQPNFGALMILFSSEGGSTDQSLSLFNFISSLPIRVRMHAVGHVGSAAVPVFLAGHFRSCAPRSRFFFHEYHWTFGGPQTLNRIDEAVQRLRSDIDLARDILKSRTEANEQILNALDGTAKPAILSAEEAKALGFVDEVLELEQTGCDGMKVIMATIA